MYCMKCGNLRTDVECRCVCDINTCVQYYYVNLTAVDVFRSIVLVVAFRRIVILIIMILLITVIMMKIPHDL